MLIAYVELRGVWTMTGGLQALAHSLTSAFQSLGGQLRTGTRVDQILQKDGRICGLLAAPNGELAEQVDLDAVVFNGDIRSLQESDLLQSPSVAIARRMTQPTSLSAMTWSTVAKVEGFGLQYHNVFFQPNLSSIACPASRRFISAPRTVWRSGLASTSPMD
jgi:1-hydroxycarotenoid 3,4-desaturase